MKRSNVAIAISLVALFFSLAGAGIAHSFMAAGPRPIPQPITMIVSNQVAVAPDSIVDEPVLCEFGHATGGGFTADEGLVIRSSKPQAVAGETDPREWDVTAVNPNPGYRMLTVWADCESFPTSSP